MLIRSRMGVSVDGYVATAEGVPTLAIMPGFEPGASHGYPEFIEGCDAVVMGRNTFIPALGAPSWPWPGLQVYVLTSQPLPAGTPEHVIEGRQGPAELAMRLRARPGGGDVHLVGGPRTIRAFAEIGELDRFEVVVLPALLGAGVRLWPGGSPMASLRLLQGDRIFAGGSAELVYSLRP